MRQGRVSFLEYLALRTEAVTALEQKEWRERRATHRGLPVN
jgi:hypothetical protein